MATCHVNREDDDIKAKNHDFYVSDNVSRVKPGKSDTVAVWENKQTSTHHKRHLVMSISDPFHQFRMNYPDVKIGKSKFAELRPKYILLFSKFPHNVCGHKYQANIILLLDALSRKYPIFPKYRKGRFYKHFCL